MFDNWLGLILRRYELFCFKSVFQQVFFVGLKPSSNEDCDTLSTNTFLKVVAKSVKWWWAAVDPKSNKKNHSEKVKKMQVPSSTYFSNVKIQLSCAFSLSRHSIHVQLFLLWEFWRACAWQIPQCPTDHTIFGVLWQFLREIISKLQMKSDPKSMILGMTTRWLLKLQQLLGQNWNRKFSRLQHETKAFCLSRL